jgi:acetate kinase
VESGRKCVLIINGGSSSIKFSLYEMNELLTQLFYGQFENIGSANTRLHFNNSITHEKKTETVIPKGGKSVVDFFIDWLENQKEFIFIKVIGHRIVHGMNHKEPEQITPELLKQIRNITSFDPEHLPEEINIIEVLGKRHPELTQIACFDTSFHSSMPAVAKLLPIPRRYHSKGIQRYGFHGISYAWLMEELKREAGSAASNGKIILAHLGSGASLAAVENGKSMDTSMGFTPASGLPMATRSGDLDPGVAWYLIQSEKLTPEQFSQLINHQSGLLGISEISSDMRELLKQQNTDKRAAEAIELFCYQTKKWIGSFAAVLGGIETLVFSGGIGENSPEIRRSICQGLQFLGIEMDEPRNLKNEPVISADYSKVCVRVIKTNEELMIAKSISQFMSNSNKNYL